MARGRPKESKQAHNSQANGSLKGVLPRDYARAGLDKQRLGQLINLLSDELGQQCVALGGGELHMKDAENLVEAAA